MATLLQSISQLLENISVTDRQEDNINHSINNLDKNIKNSDSGLHVEHTFTNGSWDRDTIIRPLDDVDLFAVLNRKKWEDEYGNLPNPQAVLSKMKKYLNELNDYKDKVKQDRPCVTVQLSDKDFDVLPSFEQVGGGYLIPNYDLKNWTYSFPEQLTTNLDEIHKLREYRVKQIIKVIKYWNRENGKQIPSYHIEETAINIFRLYNFKNFEEGIQIWYKYAETYLINPTFKSNDEYTASVNRINKTKNKLDVAKQAIDDKNEAEAIRIWKEIFGKEFPTADIDEAMSFAKSLTEGSLKISSGGILSQIAGRNVHATKGFYGDNK